MGEPTPLSEWYTSELERTDLRCDWNWQRPPWVLVVTDKLQFNLYEKPPSRWCRFWQRVLLGWKWKRRAEGERPAFRYANQSGTVNVTESYWSCSTPK